MNSLAVVLSSLYGRTKRSWQKYPPPAADGENQSCKFKYATTATVHECNLILHDKEENVGAEAPVYLCVILICLFRLKER